MNRPILLLLASLLSVSTADAAQTTKVGCGAIHALRNSDSEILTGTISVRNIDLANAVTIERLTYRNFFGDVVHDSGPAVGVPHPLNADFTPPQDITVVPPGATYYLSTNHIWGNNPIPGPAGNAQGGAMSVVVEFSKDGSRDLVVVGSGLRDRQRFFIFTPTGPIPVQGTELSRDRLICVDVK